MTYNDMLNLVLALPFDTMKEVYSNGKQSLLIYRPSTLSKRFKNYDINTNFQIFLKIGDDKPFKPNHLRLLIDLKLRAREIPQSRIELLTAFDKIFYGAEPLKAISPLTHINFTQYINPIDITAVLAQLFIIEQNIGYGNKSTFNPPSLYIHGWIKALASSKGMSVNAYMQDLVRKDQCGLFDTMQIAEKNREMISGITGNMHDGYDIIFKDGHSCHCRTKKDVRSCIIKYCNEKGD